MRVLFNMCLHRGMQVCRSELGNTSHFRCPYHAWTYSNTGELTGVPFHKDAYGGEAGLHREGVAAARAADRRLRGLIFASLDAGAPDLDDYLGGFRFFLDFYLGQSAGGRAAGPQRFRVKANWKIGAENFSGDTYHTPHTHASVVDIDLFCEPKANKRKEGALWFAGCGRRDDLQDAGAGFRENLVNIGYPDEMIDPMDGVVAAAPRAGRRRGVHALGRDDAAEPQLRAQLADGRRRGARRAVHLAPPLAAVQRHETEVLSWFAVDREAPEWYKDASYKAYLMCFGSSGMFEQDDVENWTSITADGARPDGRAAEPAQPHGADARRRDRRPAARSWPAPGRAYVGFGEYNQRELLSLWCDLLEARGANGRRPRSTDADPATDPARQHAAPPRGGLPLRRGRAARRAPPPRLAGHAHRRRRLPDARPRDDRALA